MKLSMDSTVSDQESLQGSSVSKSMIDTHDCRLEVSIRLRRGLPSTSFVCHVIRQTLRYLDVAAEMIHDIERGLTEARAHVLK
jgi:hypothetical protein